MFGACVTLAIIVALWIAVSRLLAYSLRDDDPQATAADRLSAKTAPWRDYPANRTAGYFALRRANADHEG